MTWLYIIGGIIGGIILIILILLLLGSIANWNKLKNDPRGYCEMLYQNMENGSPKIKVRALKKLFELGATGMQSALEQLWKLRNNVSLFTHETYQYLDNFLFKYDQNTWERLKAESEKREANRPKEELKYALKLLADNNPLENEDHNWWKVKHTIREISKRRPFPHDRQLHFDYLWAITSFNLSNHGSFGPDATYGGGTFEEIERKRNAALREVQDERERINSTHKKALEMLKNDGEQAVEFLRKKLSKYLDYG